MTWKLTALILGSLLAIVVIAGLMNMPAEPDECTRAAAAVVVVTKQFNEVNEGKRSPS
jgi:hypothetical protein